jgi:hypothetical protein
MRDLIELRAALAGTGFIGVLHQSWLKVSA